MPDRQDHDPLSDSLEHLIASRHSQHEENTNISCCCGRNDCPRQLSNEQQIQKAEADARLAAEIGQTLLQRHESYAQDAQAIQSNLQQKLRQLMTNNKQLEALNNEVNLDKEQALEDRDRALADKERSRKMTEAIKKDLELVSARCKALEEEKEAKESELQGVKALQVIVDQNQSMEQTMQSKMNDLLQELSSVQRNEVATESKYKKLKSRYDALHASYQMTKRQMKELENSSEDHRAFAWLKESNSKLRHDLKYIYSGSANRESQNSQLISLIQELATANNKLKGEILDQQATISYLSSRVQEAEKSDLDIEHDIDLAGDDLDIANHTTTGSFNIPISSPRKEPTHNDLSSTLSGGSWSSSILATSPLRYVKVHEELEPAPQLGNQSLLSKMDVANNSSQSTPLKTALQRKTSPSPTDHPYGVAIVKPERSSSTPLKTKFGSPLSQTSVFMTPSPPQSPNIVSQDNKHPYKMLHDLAAQLFKRLSGTEIRVLNRRLHRAFDMLKLTDLSNSIIDNVDQDIQSLDSRFSWVQQAVREQEQTWAHETIALSSFFVMVKLVQELLAEIGTLRTTLNSLQVEYVNKVNDNQSYVEKALEEKSNLDPVTNSAPRQDETAGTFSWLAQMITRAPSSNEAVKSDDDASIKTRTSANDEVAQSTSSISYLSNSIYRLAQSYKGSNTNNNNNDVQKD
ncbi:hypothetical protein INT43_000985 [Umbelopsis isabellina]|uniref:Uncharacterized protein n=1 Tax=Mortierella isabellina TaxID=91625 RepID=A0A8H7Q345_MORIS|nr:hypothetical protein INT43_000985 [Umbelopsis isabellina]